MGTTYNSGAFAQNYGYKQYNVKDGLAGSTVYCMLQDQEGFAWFATETGLSRFDGTHFRNFTTRDGLPDNTIVQMFEDSKGRLWLLPFKNDICYYYKGKIYNKENDSLLKKIRLDDFAMGIVENKYHTILIASPSYLYAITPANEVNRIEPAAVKAKHGNNKISVDKAGLFYLLNSVGVYATDTKSFTLKDTLTGTIHRPANVIIDGQLTCWMEQEHLLRVKYPLYNLDYTLPTPTVNTIQPINDSVICLNTYNGCFYLNILRKSITRHFMQGINVSYLMSDAEGGIWFSTLGSGVYRLSSVTIKNLEVVSPGGEKLAVYDFAHDTENLWAGSDHGALLKIKNDSARIIALKGLGGSFEDFPVNVIAIKDDYLVALSVNSIYVFDNKGSIKSYRGYNAGKDIAIKNGQELIIAGSNALYIKDLQKPDDDQILVPERATSVCLQHDSIYFGTLKGLYLLTPNKTLVYFRDSFPILRNRITAIQPGQNGVLWVATADGGVAALKGNRLIHQYTEDNGLASNVIHCLSVDSGCIWVGTNKGLNKINAEIYPAEIESFTMEDGLGSDMINAVEIMGNKVYVGTPAGISWFDKTAIPSFSQCVFKMLGISVNGVSKQENDRIDVKYGNNNIRFDFVAISFKSAGKINYAYRLIGLDSTWQNTSQTTIEFIALPPGEYKLELVAINKFDVKSIPYYTTIHVQSPLWQTRWFILACIGMSILLTWFVVNALNRQNKKKEVVKRNIEQKIQELEQKALRAQMNPHFIFNSLHSVQGFVLDKDFESANRYLGRFANLIRQTLENSFQSSITIADEIKYLSSYLELEKMRSQNQFNYTITIGPHILADRVNIPCMILQPYVENAILHGIKNKPDHQGKIDITFKKEQNGILCTIRDNGIGRVKASALKQFSSVYQSRGMQLTRERINLINKDLNEGIDVQIHDYTDEDSVAGGTEVVIHFPDAYLKKHSAHYD